MELVEIVRVLDHILLSNVTNIILKYYQFCRTDNQIPPEMTHVHRFCENYLNNHKIFYFVTYDVFNDLKEMLNDNCGLDIIYTRNYCYNDNCTRDLDGINIIASRMITRLAYQTEELERAFINIIKDNLIDKLYDAFLTDLASPNSAS